MVAPIWESAICRLSISFFDSFVEICDVVFESESIGHVIELVLGMASGGSRSGTCHSEKSHKAALVIKRVEHVLKMSEVIIIIVF